MTIRIAESSELSAVFALRYEVFVEEQQVPLEIEMDDEDAHALHIMAVDDDGVVGCARLLLSAEGAHIGRLAVKRDRRGRGIGASICRFIMEDCRMRGIEYIWLNAQIQAVGFYEKLGFRREGERFWEAGIEHVQMTIMAMPQ